MYQFAHIAEFYKSKLEASFRLEGLYHSESLAFLFRHYAAIIGRAAP